MKRREFIILVGGVALTCPVSGHAQQLGKVPIIGFLGANSAAAQSNWTSIFVKRLGELGWIEGRTVAIEYRWVEGHFDRAPGLVGELLRQKVDVILTHGTPNVVASKQATSEIPIVFALTGDPVGNGLVASLAHPGGNVTGMSIQSSDLGGKRVELLREMVPGLATLGFLLDPANTNTPLELREVETACRRVGLQLETTHVRQPDDIGDAIQALKSRAQALYVPQDPLLNSNRDRLNSMARAARLATLYSTREGVTAGGLMAYGPNLADNFRRAAEIVDKILRGAKPADIPVEQPTKFSLVINLKTAKTLGLTVPPTLLAAADDVIE
jgi:putative ABC transport system substrate-binding protein